MWNVVSIGYQNRVWCYCVSQKHPFYEFDWPIDGVLSIKE